MLRVYLDNTLLNSQPIGLEELEFSITFDFENRTLLRSTVSELTFIGDGFNYLYKSFLTLGYNATHDVKIEKRSGDSWFEVWNGKIFISDAQINLSTYELVVTLQDDSYNSKIYNNFKIETQLNTSKTKNGLELTDWATINANILQLVQMINPPSNTIPAVGFFDPKTSRYLYDLRVSMRQMVLFMSDNEVDFVSDWLDGLYDSGVGYGITLGKHILTRDSGDVLISWEDLFVDLARVFNLVASIDDIEGTPYLRVEPLDYYQNINVAVKCENVKEIKRSFFQELLYSNVHVGSTEAIIQTGALDYHPPFSFYDERYYLDGKTNLNSEKDLTFQTFLVDTNLIENVIVSGDTTNNDKLFLIEYNPITNQALTVNSEILGEGSYFYNGSLTNNSIIRRHPWANGQKALLGDPDEEISVLKVARLKTCDSIAASLFELTDIQFETETADPGGHYTPANGRYTATADGTKNVRVGLRWFITEPFDLMSNPNGVYSSAGVGHPVFYGFVYYLTNSIIRVYSSLGVLQRTYTGAQDRRIWSDCIEHDASQRVTERTRDFYTIYLKDTEYFTVSLEVNRVVATNFGENFESVPLIDSTVQPDDAFTNSTGNLYLTEMSNLQVLVGTNLSGQPIGEINRNYLINRWEFSNTINDKEVIDILQDPKRAILLTNSKENINLRTWAKSVTIKPLTNETSFEVINNIETL